LNIVPSTVAHMLDNALTDNKYFKALDIIKILIKKEYLLCDDGTKVNITTIYHFMVVWLDLILGNSTSMQKITKQLMVLIAKNL